MHRFLLHWQERFPLQFFMPSNTRSKSLVYILPVYEIDFYRDETLMIGAEPTSRVDVLKDLRTMWRKGIPTYGPFVQLNAPGICEILGHAGFDFCIIDLEHGVIHVDTAENMVRAANAAGIVPIIRVAFNRKELISQALNVGASAVHIPHISTRQEAEEAVWASKFFPLGGRGVCPFVRAARYSADKTIYYSKANTETMVIVAIEGTEGIDNLQEILQVKGVDAVFVGPYDLSQSLGVPGQVAHEKVLGKVREICELSKKAGVAVGLFVETPEAAKEWVKHGVLYCCLDVDAAMLLKASMSYVKQVREATAATATIR
jgi:4-hydroxy-2-oxoheptanedioate aldolase